MNKQISLLLLFVLVLSSFTFAAPPFSVGSNPTNGYDIITTPYEFVKANQDFIANFHVFNRSNGIPLDNGSSTFPRYCYLHLYNHSGNAILETKVPYDNVSAEWKINITKGNFSTIGQYAWIVFCNSSMTGGFLSSLYQVTNNGLDDSNKDNTSGIAIVLFLCLIISGLFILPFKTTFAKGIILNDMLKSCCWLIALFLLSLATAMVNTIASNGNLGFGSELFTILWLVNMASYLMMFYVGLSFLWRVIDVMVGNSKKSRVGKHEIREEDDEE